MTKTKVSVQEVAAEISQLITTVEGTDGAIFVRLPIYYPGGAGTVVRITRHSLLTGNANYDVSDFGIGHDEAEAMGVVRTYNKQAHKIAERAGIIFDDEEVQVRDVDRSQLAWAAITVANASCRAAVAAAQKVEDAKKEADAEILYQRLVHIFQAQNVARHGYMASHDRHHIAGGRVMADAVQDAIDQTVELWKADTADLETRLTALEDAVREVLECDSGVYSPRLKAALDRLRELVK